MAETCCRRLFSPVFARLCAKSNKQRLTRCKSSFAGSPDGKYRKVAVNHIYKAVHPWKTREDLAKFLCDSVVYNQGGLIAVNKPYGVGIHQQVKPDSGGPSQNPGGRLIVETLSSSELSHCSLSISETLPLLADALKVDQLRIMNSTEKYTSGILLLSSNPLSEEHVAKAIRRAKAQTVPFYTYWAVTSCIPIELKENKKRVGIKIMDIAEHGEKVAVIDVKPSKRGVLVRGDVKSAVVEYEVAKFNRQFNSALIEISTSRRSWHFIRVYLAHKLAPIIGDALYSTRVKNILGKPAAISPHNKACYDPPTLSVDLCNRLRIPPKAVPSLPTHLHLHRINLIGYDKGGRNLLIECPPSDFFGWTCKQLELLPDKLEQEKLTA